MSDRIQKSEITRRRILDAAAALFSDQGYAATTMRQIAERAQIDASSAYYYFESKEELLDEVMQLGVRAVSDAVQKAVGSLPEGTSHRERIEVAVTTHLNTLLKYSVYTSANIAIFGQLSPAVQKRHRQQRRDYGVYWDDLLRAAQGAGEIAKTANLSLLRLFILGSINWSLQWYDPKRKPIAEIARTFCAMVFDGVGTRPS